MSNVIDDAIRILVGRSIGPFHGYNLNRPDDMEHVVREVEGVVSAYGWGIDDPDLTTEQITGLFGVY